VAVVSATDTSVTARRCLAINDRLDDSDSLR
jgi:hypothetical protein